MSGVDFIGDVHAQGTRLGILLRNLGYSGPRYIHPDGRKAIFIGDLIDRGTEHALTFDIVCNMDGAIVLKGNHEFNAECYAMEGLHLHIRPRTEQNTQDLRTFLEEFPIDSPGNKDILKWFSTFPIYLDTPEYRAVHACWDRYSIRACKNFLNDDKSLRPEAYKAYDKDKPPGFADALDNLLKGPSFKFAGGVTYRDSEGQYRKSARIHWWVAQKAPLQVKLRHGDEVMPFLTFEERTVALNLKSKFNYKSQKPVFYGHYNMAQEPALLARKSACLNFKDRIVAYRWNHGDRGLSADRLEYV